MYLTTLNSLTGPDPTQKPKRIRILGVKGKDNFFFEFFHVLDYSKKRSIFILFFKIALNHEKKAKKKITFSFDPHDPNPDPLLVFGSDPDPSKKFNGSETLLIYVRVYELEG